MNNNNNNKNGIVSSWYYMGYLLQIIKIIQLFFTSFFYFNSTNETNKEMVITDNKTPTEMYTDKHLTSFMNSFECENRDGSNYNSNIDTGFYSKEKYVELLKEPDNELEREWKKRILIEYTPRGNVFMLYDPYKLGFSYYCDQYVPYNILNAVAMKYVLKFQCRDFFMDEYVVPEISPSPLLKLFIDEKKVKEIEDNLDSNIKNRLRNAPFAKFKSYNRANIQDTKKEGSQNIPKAPEKQKEINRFINLGKSSNFSLLQPVVKKKRAGTGGSLFKSMLATSLFDNSSVQNEVFSYREFKAGKL